MVRTGELLAARGIDGGEQLFTRSRDFGYSKSTEETLAHWGHDEALDDVVRAIRAFRPDVIVTRFPKAGTTHGHHLASAVLAEEAFALAADPAYPTEGLEPWSADRLVHNRSSWRIDEGTDTSQWSSIDVSAYDPLTGSSSGQIAAASRTMHKSQGFGSSPRLGPQLEYFTSVAGAPIFPGASPLEGLDLTLGRFEGTRPLIKALERTTERFDPRAPHELLPDLARLADRLEDLPDPHWRALKLSALEALMIDCAGLWLTADTDARAVAPGESLAVQITALARAQAPVELLQIRLSPGVEAPVGAPLRHGEPHTAALDLPIPADQPLTLPHWLKHPPTAARYTIEDPAWRNQADTPPGLTAAFDLRVAGRPITVIRPIEHASTDPVAGHQRHPVEILPPVTASFEHTALLIPDGGARSRLTLRSEGGDRSGVLRLSAPRGITVAPSEIAFELTSASPEQIVELELHGGSDAASGELVASVDLGAPTPAWQRALIDYPHLPRRTVLRPAALPLRPIALDRGAIHRVGYVPGSGDAVADSLAAVGYAVETLAPSSLATTDLASFDAIVLGIRAFNTRPELHTAHDHLMAYVHHGGRVIVQYNTSNRWRVLEGPVGPTPFSIDRGRVTDEAAEVVLLEPDHPALASPNPITAADFGGWVQERGLYFAESWGEGYTPLLAMHDAGEAPLEGSLLVARHGEGAFVYTGLSFFRQLPAGVPGAMRLFANLMAL